MKEGIERIVNGQPKEESLGGLAAWREAQIGSEPEDSHAKTRRRQDGENAAL
jgi:hypothetical protein